MLVQALLQGGVGEEPAHKLYIAHKQCISSIAAPNYKQGMLPRFKVIFYYTFNNFLLLYIQLMYGQVVLWFDLETLT